MSAWALDWKLKEAARLRQNPNPLGHRSNNRRPRSHTSSASLRLLACENGTPIQPIIKRQGDTVYFADKVLKFTNSGKIKRRILIITDSAVYIIDPKTNALKRRITLAAVEMICLSKLSDNLFAVIIPMEYDLLMASMRKIEIVTALLRPLFSKCPLIRNSAKLKRIMQTILSPGNALNQGTANSNILHSYSSEFVSSRDFTFNLHVFFS